MHSLFILQTFALLSKDISVLISQTPRSVCLWSWSPRDFGRLVGVITSGARASLAPVRISRDAMDYVRDEMLAIIDDFLEGRRFLGVFKSSTKKDLAIDANALPTVFDPDKSHSFSAPLMHSYVEIIGEIGSGGGVSLSFAIPRPGSHVYIVERGDALSGILKLPQGLFIGYHKFANLEIDVNPIALDYHIAVLGATGSGKSRLVKAIIEEVLRKAPNYRIVIFDHTGVDYADLSRWTGFENSISVIDSSNIVLEPDVIADIIVDQMGLRRSEHQDYVYGAVIEYIRSVVEEVESPLQQAKTRGFGRRNGDIELGELLKKYKELSSKGLFKWDFNQFVNALETYLKNMNARQQTIEKLRLLLYTRVGRAFFEQNMSRRSTVIDDVVTALFNDAKRVIIIDLSTEVEYSAKNAIVYQFIKKIWDTILYKRSRANIIAVVDEAHNYCCAYGCDPAKDIIARTSREGRKWGFGLILSSQRVIDLAPEIRGNINTVFFSRMQTSGDYNELRNWLEGVEYMEYTLPLLSPREFFFTGLGNPLRRPLLVKVRDVA